MTYMANDYSFSQSDQQRIFEGLRHKFVLGADEPAGGWQECPICGGKGIVPQFGFESLAVHKTCDVCDGKKIISTATGKPPAD